MNEEIAKTLEDHEKRIAKLEKIMEKRTIQIEPYNTEKYECMAD